MLIEQQYPAGRIIEDRLELGAVVLALVHRLLRGLDDPLGLAEDRLVIQRLQRIAHVGQRSQRIDVVHFKVRYGAHAARTPVDDTLAAIDQAFIIESHEHLAHGL